MDFVKGQVQKNTKGRSKASFDRLASVMTDGQSGRLFV
jgi:hypothetical protein